MTGRIIKGVGGFFHVMVETIEMIETDKANESNSYKDTVIICNSKGVFRKEKIKPLVGDIVEIAINHDHREEDKVAGIIEKIGERKNELVRPAIANIDVLFIVSAAKSPSPDCYFIDKMTAIAVNNNIEPVIIMNKIDLADCVDISDIYAKAGFEVINTSAVDGIGFERVKHTIEGKVCAFAGASGVGKSSLLNKIFENLNLNLETNTLSQKIERGRHTTRTVELFRTATGYIADTPGFSVLDFEKFNYIAKDNLIFAFPDLEPYATDCKYTKCTHTKEDGCSIIRAVEEDKIAASRHESYVHLYEQVKNQKEWEMKD